jgi:hypothetical protein
MHAVIIVFWTTFFVNQRGCANRDLLKSLFYYLVENCPLMEMLDEDQKGDYFKEFSDIHDHLLDKFIESIGAVCDKWVESDAGTAFIESYYKAKFALLYRFQSNMVEKATGQGLS